jgi:integrase
LRLAGKDPLDEKRQAGQQRRALRSFRWCAEAYHAAHQAEWSAKHTGDWLNSLTIHAYPVLAEMPVAAINAAAVLPVLQPIWTEHTVTADRVRSRIEQVLSWATTSGYRTGENPARWKGHLENLLAKKTRVARVSHLAALPYKELPVFIARLRRADSITAAALEFTILTCARSGEALGTVWSEIDLQARLECAA